MKITIEFDTIDQLAGLIGLRDKERDALRDEVAKLKLTPLQYSLPWLANKVLDRETGISSLTPGQTSQLRELIEAA